MIIINDSGDKEAVKRYLNTEFSCGSKTCKSSYFAALRHARELTGRCLKDGSIEIKEHSRNWAGACMYLILIDHIGGKFGNKDKDCKENCSFLKALESFTELEKGQRDILYQLRCSFLHQFNLYDLQKNKKYTDRHFSVHIGSELISLPEIEFNGKLSNISEKNKTSISLLKVGDLVEEMHKKILCLLDDNKLEVEVPQRKALDYFLDANTICYQVSRL